MTRTFTLEAGELVVTCTGSHADWSVAPAPSWTADVTPLAQSELDARFVRGKAQVVEVMATCQDGVPVFSS